MDSINSVIAVPAWMLVGGGVACALAGALAMFLTMITVAKWSARNDD